MTEPESTQSIPEAEARASAPEMGASAEAPAPEPEPWTPERVAEWNAYYDLYVTLGVLLLAFVASANKITHSSIWPQLQVGRMIVEKAAPVVTDPFSYTAEGRRWVNIPWLFEASHAMLHRAASDLAPTDPTDPAASATRADQFGAGVLVALNALARVATVLVVLGIRRRGPGLWWAAVCATVALGAVFSPVGWISGGIATPARVEPETWGQLLLALELVALHRTINLGRRGAALALIPLFLLWANLDDSFVAGLIVLAAAVAGLGLTRSRCDDAGAPSLPAGLAVWTACAVACLANPSSYRVYPAALEPIAQLFRPSAGAPTYDQLSYFGKSIWGDELGKGLGGYLVAYYLLFVGLGVGSFALNRRHFSPSRFLMFAAAAVLWGALIRFNAAFAVVFAATVTLNGQEWYHDRFGTRGRLGRGWALWSIGGRAVTIILVFTLSATILTGWGQSFGEVTFGFGYDPDDFAFEAADYLKSAPIRGRVLNTTMLQGDSLIWRAWPERKTFIDSRQHLFPPEVLRRLQETRLALKDDAVGRWKPLLETYQISAVMIQEAGASNTYRMLSRSPNWIPFYDDGDIVMFGRADAPAADLAYFKANRLDPEELAYRRSKPVPPTERPPSPTTWMDQIFRRRALARPQPHTQAARRWLEGPNPDAPLWPDPARCLLAIREARAALARRPDDTRAYRLLSVAYRDLMAEEAALQAGLKLTPETAAQVRRLRPRAGQLMTRFRQRATALNYAIQTTPPPRSRLDRRALFDLNDELSQLYLSVNFVDLARDRIGAMLDLLMPGDVPNEDRDRLRSSLARLDGQVTQVRQRMDELRDESQAGPMQRASFAVSQGMPGLAIQELEEALQTGIAPGAVKPRLFDLDCDTGQPEKALELISGSNIDDPALGSEPGAAALRQGRVYFLLGNAEYAAILWEKHAIPRLRFDRSFQALGAALALVRGEAQTATSTVLTIPNKTNAEALWENDLAFCRLEGGTPGLAVEPFTDALKLVPNLSARPIIAYYLEKLGKQVPPALPAEDTSALKDQAPKDQNPENRELKE
ncbi:MAG: hypothetical protein JO252_24480 [Planctomycetaceae bacterium]|nr:hypothetical protein [Planctomycetaceae bacterium]